jgi:glycosyltransferase involved in cell wall biosynthesis
MDGETGLVVSQRDSRRLAEAILRLRREPGLCLRMGRAGRERARRFFNNARMVNDMLEEYERVRHL